MRTICHSIPNVRNGRIKKNIEIPLDTVSLELCTLDTQQHLHWTMHGLQPNYHSWYLEWCEDQRHTTQAEQKNSVLV